MEQKRYEIWTNEDSQTWKIFTNVTEDLRKILIQTGWTLVFQSGENETSGQDIRSDSKTS